VPLQDGHLKAAYGLTAAASTVTLVVRNEAGDIVYSEAGVTTQGVHPFEWDGKDQYGVQLEDGVYSISVTSLGADEAPVDSYVTAFGRVTGVTTINNQTVLLLGKVGIPIDSVLSVTETDQQPDEI
jgi:flagellar basal-body rod modification protein FlgD